jgi:hypothetical protein
MRGSKQPHVSQKRSNRESPGLLETQLAADLSADDKHPATISVDGEFE